MGNSESSLTPFELRTKKEMLESNLSTLNVLIKREYASIPVNISKVREYKTSIKRITKQLNSVNKSLDNGKQAKYSRTSKEEATT